MSGEMRPRTADELLDNLAARIYLGDRERPGRQMAFIQQPVGVQNRYQAMALSARDAIRREQAAGDETILNEWGVEWTEKWSGLLDVSGPYLTAKEARDALANSAYDGRVVWRTKTTTTWRDWPTTQPRTPAGSTEEATS